MLVESICCLTRSPSGIILIEFSFTGILVRPFRLAVMYPRNRLHNSNQFLLHVDYRLDGEISVKLVRPAEKLKLCVGVSGEELISLLPS